MARLLAIGLGGFVGALCRYGLAGLVQTAAGPRFPAGTLVVNVLGCFAIGALAALVEGRLALSPEWRLFLLVGLLGSFTTFSTFGYETLELLRAGSFPAAALNLGAHVVLGLGAVALGRAAVLSLP